MVENESSKDWVVRDGTLRFETNHGVIVPTAEEIYSAIFEQKYSSVVDANDVSLLMKRFNFSKYPARLYIDLISLVNYTIVANIHVESDSGKDIVLPDTYKADHIVIESTWYPFEIDAFNDILKILDTAGISKAGKIKLGQYLLLLKSPSDQIHYNIELDKLKPLENANKEKPSVNAQLYPYQIKGWEWLRFLKSERVGGILADEMDLEKLYKSFH